MPKSERRSYKVSSSSNPNTKHGLVVVNPTVDAVLEKACLKLDLSPEGCALVTSDGTIVDDDGYLLSDDLKPPNNHLIVEMPKSASSTLRNLSQIVSDLKALYDEDPDGVLEEMVRHQLNSPSSSTIFSGIREHLSSKEDLEKREDDPVWFTNTNPRFKTKSKFMRDRARSRIVGYLRVAKDHAADADDADKKKIMKEVVNKLVEDLRQADYFEGYFDRHDVYYRLCDEKGNFACRGLYNEDRCQYQSTTNPYASLKNRVEFSSWNLDHIIEKSRSVLPSLTEAAEKVLASGGRLKVNSRYFFQLLFTTDNLKLVETACHDKTEHSDRSCDPRKIVVKA